MQVVAQLLSRTCPITSLNGATPSVKAAYRRRPCEFSRVQLIFTELGLFGCLVTVARAASLDCNTFAEQQRALRSSVRFVVCRPQASANPLIHPTCRQVETARSAFNLQPTAASRWIHAVNQIQLFVKLGPSPDCKRLHRCRTNTVCVFCCKCHGNMLRFYNSSVLLHSNW